MKTIIAALPLFAALVVATPAAAQDTTPSAERTFNIRGELQFGYEEIRTAYITSGGAQERDIGLDGFTFGAEVGVDARVTDKLLAGAYANVAMSQLEKCRGNNFNSSTQPSDEFCFNGGTGYRAGLRAGLLAGDNGVIYIKGGLSRAKIGASYKSRPVPTGPVVTRFDQSETAKGYHIGAGAELDLGRSTYVKAEYVYDRYQNLYEGRLPAGDNLDPSRHSVLFGFGVRLGR